MVDRFQSAAQARNDKRTPDAWARDGILMGLASNVEGPEADLWRRRHPELRQWTGADLARYPTVFDRLDRRLCRLLIYRGWWLTGACLAKYYPGLVQLPAQAPPLL
jgi:NTE family protein